MGSPDHQLVYDSGVPDGLHTHVPSEAASVPQIHAVLPAAAVASSAFSSSECTLASSMPAARQAALALLHDSFSFISVYAGPQCVVPAVQQVSVARVRVRVRARARARARAGAWVRGIGVNRGRIVRIRGMELGSGREGRGRRRGRRRRITLARF